MAPAMTQPRCPDAEKTGRADPGTARVERILRTTTTGLHGPDGKEDAMPFMTPPPQRRRGDLTWAWESVPHHEHVVSGDALFLEDDRTDGRLMFLLIDVMHHGPKPAFVV